jgi:glycyl-tRNA synthetase alpha subunit
MKFLNSTLIIFTLFSGCNYKNENEESRVQIQIDSALKSVKLDFDSLSLLYKIVFDNLKNNPKSKDELKYQYQNNVSSYFNDAVKITENINVLYAKREISQKQYVDYIEKLKYLSKEFKERNEALSDAGLRFNLNNPNIKR